MWSLPERLVGLVIALLIAFGIGWASCHTYDKGHEVKTLIAEKHETAQAIEQSTQTSVKVDTDIAADHTRIDTIKSAVSIRLSTPTYRIQNDPVHDLRPDPAAPAGVAASPERVLDPVLDAGTVRLLNAARAGTELRAASGNDGKKPAAPDPAR